ncbi:MAG: hypothetical protein WAT89_10450 [Candidatus Kapaibacterium sp.]
MKNNQRFVIVIVSAIITFGTLFATIGKPPFVKHFSHFAHCDQTEVPKTPQK